MLLHWNKLGLFGTYLALFSAIILNRDLFVFSSGGVETSIFVLVYSALLPVLLFGFFLRKTFPVADLLLLCGYIAFLCGMLASAFGRELAATKGPGDLSVSIRILLYSAILPLVYWLFAERGVTARQIFLAWWMIFLAVVIVGMLQVLAVQLPDSLFSRYFYWENVRGGERRIASLFRWQGPLVLFIGLSLPILLYYGRLEPCRTLRKLIAISGVVGVAVLAMTGSRTVIPILLVTFLLAPLVLDRGRRFMVLYYGIGSSTFVILLGVVALGDFEGTPLGRLVGKGAHVQTFLESPRLQIWIGVLEKFSTSVSTFLFGIGGGSSRELTGLDPHSSAVEMMAEQGLVSFFGWVLFWISVGFLAHLRARRGERRIGRHATLAACWGVSFVYLFSASAIHYPWVYIFFGGLVYAIGRPYSRRAVFNPPLWNVRFNRHAGGYGVN